MNCDFGAEVPITRTAMPRTIIYADCYWRLTAEGVVKTRGDEDPGVLVDAAVVPLPVARALGLFTV
jgi:hypothetical protein